jgi:sulfatase modifying factor 1
MKNIAAIFMITLVFLFACSKRKIPTSPILNTPTRTATFNNTKTLTATKTATLSATITKTNTITDTQTMTDTFTCTQTVTETVTQTNTPNITQTIEAQQTAEALQTAVSNILYNSIADVPGGTFMQTDETGANGFSHTISTFRIGKYEVTYELWYTVYRWAILPAQGYVFANAGREGKNGTIGAATTSAKYEPVTTINWRDMIIWCNAYSQMTGLTPIYYSDAGYTTPIKISTNNTVIETVLGTVDNPYVNWNTNGYRLPTEGEWHYAASWKGTDSLNGSIEYPVSSGNYWTSFNYAPGDIAPYGISTTIGNYCWYSGNSGNITHAVGEKLPNALDIYDMGGNVLDMCWDWYDDYPTATSNYRGPASGYSHVLRGGNFFYGPGGMAVAPRNGYGPYNAYNSGGFRFARTY